MEGEEESVKPSGMKTRGSDAGGCRPLKPLSAGCGGRHSGEVAVHKEKMVMCVPARSQVSSRSETLTLTLTGSEGVLCAKIKSRTANSNDT